jgi:hypothetical protein
MENEIAGINKEFRKSGTQINQPEREKAVLLR